ncbi:MAG: CAP domain-containing protein [Armatimonadota bacterium]|nr:CAP domain-containing protein [Armatimonadota bacterium]MCX7778088.1 CAP domain-containing protein [Armatimonadota bacterium]MDW8025476.1 CAP domain-containing protein [Armatimonadota bacterium]
MRCPACGREHKKDASYCPFTGVRLLWRERFSLLLIIIVLPILATKNCGRLHHEIKQPYSAAQKSSRNDNDESTHKKAAVKLSPSDLTRLERLIFELVNGERRKHGLAELMWHDGVAKAARFHSQNMASRKFFSHVDPIEGDLKERLRRNSLKVSVAAENIFNCYGFTDLSEAALKCLQSWMRSEGHRRSILLTTVTFTGVGAARSSDGEIYVTQIFTAP